jgi:hypothetical protein
VHTKGGGRQIIELLKAEKGKTTGKLKLTKLLLPRHHVTLSHRLHFATDSWTSPNHRAFIAWTVHLEYEGEMLAFLLDIVELPEVCQIITRIYNY